MDYVNHPNLRRKTAAYRARRSRLTGLWLCVGILSTAALASGRGELAILCALLGTFLSFVFLDEHEQIQQRDD